MPGPVYAQQGINAAHASRLNPYALHRGEQQALQDHLCHLHVTTYLNIRNGILRLWTRNPMVSVTLEEAMGCAKDFRWMGLSAVAYEWLIRNGYINFGCVEIPKVPIPPKRGRRRDGPVIVVVGAGVSGLGCARQLEGLFQQYRDSTTSPRVIVLEGRRRIGGRVYSHPLKSHQSPSLPEGLRPTAEMGAQIIVGFDHGNPLDPIIRSQLALRHHLLRDISTIYDIDGSAVDEMRDAMDERVYNDVLDRSGHYRHEAVINPTAEGDREMINHGRDMTADDAVTVKQYEDARATGTVAMLLPAARLRRGIGHKTARMVPPPTAQIPNLGPNEELPAAMECQSMGWELRDGVSAQANLNLDPIAKASSIQTLGAVMDEGIKQYERMLPLTPKDMRLLNWHFANLEYANATNLGTLSLSGWDQDMGNEFEGEHGQVIGGYQQLPRGLWCVPTKLDVHPNKVVTKITYDASGMAKNPKTFVHCEDGETIAADHVVYTGSLGTLKGRTVQFEPPLPEWKSKAIDRLGFGVMNKVVLVFDEAFWDVNRDMFGLLRSANDPESMKQEDYATNRGRFYLFWNCVKTSGLPVLIALMAGDAALQAETRPDAEIVSEVTSQLRNIFKTTTVPDPLETIVTRWKSDRFTRGSYSFVAAEALPGDYDLVAKPVGNLHFAGEATCGTHPATVHGAYLSGLRAAAEIIETVQGPIAIPTPLVLPGKNGTIAPTFFSPGGVGSIASTSSPGADKPKQSPKAHGASTKKNPTSQAKQQPAAAAAPSSTIPDSLHAAYAAYTAALDAHMTSTLGPPPPKPAKIALNPFLTFQRDYWQRARDRCESSKRVILNDPTYRAARDEIRAALGQMWREADDAIKRPYHDRMEVNRQTNNAGLAKWKVAMAEYDTRVREERRRREIEMPFEVWKGMQKQ
jgi:lysine-specific histone demethylase 1